MRKYKKNDSKPAKAKSIYEAIMPKKDSKKTKKPAPIPQTLQNTDKMCNLLENLLTAEQENGRKLEKLLKKDQEAPKQEQKAPTLTSDIKTQIERLKQSHPKIQALLIQLTKWKNGKIKQQPYNRGNCFSFFVYYSSLRFFSNFFLKIFLTKKKSKKRNQP